MWGEINESFSSGAYEVHIILEKDAVSLGNWYPGNSRTSKVPFTDWPVVVKLTDRDVLAMHCLLLTKFQHM